MSCAPLSRDRSDPSAIGLNDALGNYSLTLIDSLSTLAILAGGPSDGGYTGSQALSDFQDGVAEFVLHYGDGRQNSPGQGGLKATGFDLDSKVQVFETVIRGVGGLLSAHLFAVGDLPIRGYNPTGHPGFSSDDPLETAPIKWPNGFQYDGQLLRLALDLSERLLPAFYTKTGLPYPRVNLRTGIPFYVNSPLHQDGDATGPEGSGREITETCSAGAGSLTLEFTVLSRLTGDPRFEQAAKRAFWEVWQRRSEIGLIGNGIDAERGVWIGPHSGIGAGMDSFFEYALKSHILLSGHSMPNISASRRQSTTEWLDPNTLHPPLPTEMHSSDAFFQAWHQAHASVKRYLYTDRSHYPYYSNTHRATGQPYTMWIDSLGAFYPGLLALAGEVEEAVEANLVYTALWTRYSALPERWSVRENNVEPGIGWWPGRPEFIESTYHIYRATRDPWYLRVGEMVISDIQRRCWAPCGWAGLQDVRTGEKADRMESFFLGETTKYMYLLFEPDHPLNNLDAAYVFTTEGHPLLIPKKTAAGRDPRQRRSRKTDISIPRYYDDSFTNSCPAPRAPTDALAGSNTAARRDLFDVSRFTDLFNTPNINGPLKAIEVDDKKEGKITKYQATSNHSLFPWTLPPSMLPSNGTCIAPPNRIISWVEFPASDAASSLISRLGRSLLWYQHVGPTIQNLDGLKLQMEQERSEADDAPVWKVTHVGKTQLGRHETVFFHSEHIKSFKDDAFTTIRRRDIVDVVLYVEPTPPETNASISLAADETFFNEPLSPSSDVSLPSDEQQDDESSESDTSLLKSILRAVSSVLDAASTDIPTADSNDDDSSIYTWQASMPTGAGAYPVPSVPDTPITSSPGYNAQDPGASFPWKTVYLGGQACDGPLPEESSRRHQVIVLQRGGCSFSNKLDNIPTFAPGRSSLQLVVVVDEQEAGKEQEVPRPLLEAEQMTPRGSTRLHGIPMVLMRGGKGDYELFGRAAGVGMRRKYLVKSQGYFIDNAIVL